jgi:hypothetical protein
MQIFTNLDSAQRAGFHWVEYRTEYQLHQVERHATRQDGYRVRMLAWARPSKQEQETPGSTL